MNPKIKAFLDLIAFSEGTKGKGDNGYNVIVGGDLFSDYTDHPRKKVYIKSIDNYSTAAGRYQILSRRICLKAASPAFRAFSTSAASI